MEASDAEPSMYPGGRSIDCFRRGPRRRTRASVRPRGDQSDYASPPAFRLVGRAARHASVTRRATSYESDSQLVSPSWPALQSEPPALRGIRPGMDRSWWNRQEAAVSTGAPVSRTALPAPLDTESESPYRYTERSDSGCVNSMDSDDFPRVPVWSRTRIGLRQRHLHRPADSLAPGRPPPVLVRGGASATLDGLMACSTVPCELA